MAKQPRRRKPWTLRALAKTACHSCLFPRATVRASSVRSTGLVGGSQRPRCLVRQRQRWKDALRRSLARCAHIADRRLFAFAQSWHRSIGWRLARAGRCLTCRTIESETVQLRRLATAQNENPRVGAGLIKLTPDGG